MPRPHAGDLLYIFGRTIHASSGWQGGGSDLAVCMPQKGSSHTAPRRRGDFTLDGNDNRKELCDDAHEQLLGCFVFCLFPLQHAKKPNDLAYIVLYIDIPHRSAYISITILWGFFLAPKLQNVPDSSNIGLLSDYCCKGVLAQCALRFEIINHLLPCIFSPLLGASHSVSFERVMVCE